MKSAIIALCFSIAVPAWAETPRPRPVFHVLFDLNSAVVGRDGLSVLEQALEYSKEHPELPVRIQGHADWSGPDDLNDDLSRRRAEAVRNHLLKRAIPARTLKIEWWGEKRPLVIRKPDDPIPQNRRVEISFW